MQEEEEQPKENKYNARPPQTVHDYNPEVGPSTYEPEVEYVKPAGSIQCTDTFGRSEVERTIQWEKDIQNRDPTLKL